MTSALKFDANEKVFIDRSESKFNHCQLQNNNEIKEFLINKGFSVYKAGQLTFEEQVYLFKNAKIIIGAHGAAFGNLVFCSANAKVVEIKPINHPNFVSKTIGKINNLDFHYIETPKLETKNVLGDIHIDIKILNRYL